MIFNQEGAKMQEIEIPEGIDSVGKETFEKSETLFVKTLKSEIRAFSTVNLTHKFQNCCKMIS
jgi:hypothetical protein